MSEFVNEVEAVPAEDLSAATHAAPLTNRRIVRSAMVVMLGFLFTKLISLGQVIIIADLFPPGDNYDTYVIANKVPTQIIKLVGVGAFSVAFIPIFTGLLNRHKTQEAWRLASQMFNTILMLTLIFSLIVFLLAPLMVEHVLASGFATWQVNQTAIIMRILLLSTVIITMSSLITGMLNGHNHFFLTVLAPIFFDIGLLFGVIFFTGSMGVYGLAWGTVLGALLHFLIQVPGMFMFKAKWYPAFGWHDPELRQVVKLMLPRILASFAFSLNFIVIGRVATGLGSGAASAFDYGVRIMDIPEALIGTAMGFVIFPTLAALSELGEVDRRREVFSQAIRFILITTIPAAALMIILGKPAISILFPDPQYYNLTYAVVQIMALALVFQATHEVVARTFYAQKDTRTPLLVTIAAMLMNMLVLAIFYSLNTALDIPLASPLGVGSLAIGYTTIFLVEVGVLTHILQRRWENIDGPHIRQTVIRTLAATLFMALPVLLIDYGMSQTIFTEGGRVAGIIRAGIGGVLGSGLFLVGAFVFNIEEVKQLPTLWRNRKQLAG